MCSHVLIAVSCMFVHRVCFVISTVVVQAWGSMPLMHGHSSTLGGGSGMRGVTSNLLQHMVGIPDSDQEHVLVIS